MYEIDGFAIVLGYSLFQSYLLLKFTREIIEGFVSRKHRAFFSVKYVKAVRVHQIAIEPIEKVVLGSSVYWKISTGFTRPRVNICTLVFIPQSMAMG